MSDSNDDIIKKLNEKLDRNLKQSGFLDRYGTDVLITTIVFIAYGIVFIYYQIRNDLESLRVNWDKNKCDPRYMPFAGYINPPTDGDKLKFTYDNFKQCADGILAIIMKGQNEELSCKIKYLQFISNLQKNSSNTLNDSVSTYQTYVDKVGLKSKNKQSEFALNIHNLWTKLWTLAPHFATIA